MIKFLKKFWKKFINLFKPSEVPLVLKEEAIDYSKLTKGDLKKLKAQGKIQDINKYLV